MVHSLSLSLLVSRFSFRSFELHTCVGMCNWKEFLDGSFFGGGRQWKKRRRRNSWEEVAIGEMGMEESNRKNV